MKKLFAVLSVCLLVISGTLLAEGGNSIYNYTVKTIDGKDISLKQFRGKKILIVNTASKCGFTPQYEQLESLYKEFGGDKFVILGFPANNFLSQEPGTNSEIKEFCESKYKISFPMMAKISVKGKGIHPLYMWLTQKKLNGVMDSEVKWNFQKYLIDEKGNLISVIPPKDTPNNEKIMNWLKN